MSRIAIRMGFLLLAFGALSACIGMGSVRPANVTAAYHPSIMGYIASRGGLPTEVSGNPFDAPDEDVGLVVRETMEQSHFGPNFPFLAEKPQGFSSPYRMVVALDSQTGNTYHALCSGNVAPAGPKANGGDVRVTAALCSSDSIITGTAGRISGIRTPNDPEFVSLIAQITHELFPLTSEQDREDREIIFLP